MGRVKAKEVGVCKAEECSGSVRAWGYCNKHYTQVKKFGRLTPEREKNPGRVCNIEGCNEEYYGKGICKKHYDQRRGQRRYEKDKEKIIKQSKQWRLDNPEKYKLSNFSYYWANREKLLEHSKQYRKENAEVIRERKKKYHEDNKEKISIESAKRYKENADQVKRNVRIYQQNNKDKLRLAHRRKQLALYGLSLDDYDVMLKAQNGVCAICGNQETDRDKQTNKVRCLAVDHCHETGEVRGLLCRRCNTGLGLFGTMSFLLKACSYLEKSSGLKKQHETKVVKLRVVK